MSGQQTQEYKKKNAKLTITDNQNIIDQNVGKL